MFSHNVMFGASSLALNVSSAVSRRRRILLDVLGTQTDPGFPSGRYAA